MRQKHIEQLFSRKPETKGLVRDGNNAWYVLSYVIPFLHLSQADKQVMRWAYGADGESKSYEIESDGETGVTDFFLGGAIKSPGGVVHDYLNRVPGHKTPDKKVWTLMQANNIYYRISKAIGYPPLLRARRWAFLSLYRLWWR